MPSLSVLPGATHRSEEMVLGSVRRLSGGREASVLRWFDLGGDLIPLASVLGEFVRDC